MTTEVRIAREKTELPGGSQPLTEVEWRRVIDEHAEFVSIEEAARTHSDGSTFADANPLFACWTGHSSGDRYWLLLKDGEVILKNPDDAVLRMATSLASTLGAEVKAGEN